MFLLRSSSDMAINPKKMLRTRFEHDLAHVADNVK